MTAQLVAIDAINTITNEKVCFLVVAENIDRAGWPLLAKYGGKFTEQYEPLTFRPMCPAPDRKPQVLDAFGPPLSLPPSSL